MKRFLTMLAVMFCAMSLWGCMGSVQIEARNYVMAMGIDYDTVNEEYIVSFSFPDLKALTGDGDNIHYPVMEIRGKNLKEVEDIYHQESSKRLDFGQLQTVIFGAEVLENKPLLELMVSYMKMHQTFTRTIYVCGTMGSASEIVALDESVNGSIGIYIRDMFENNGTAYGYEEVMLNDLIVARADKNETVTLALLETDEKIPWVAGTTEISFK